MIPDDRCIQRQRTSWQYRCTKNFNAIESVTVTVTVTVTWRGSGSDDKNYDFSSIFLFLNVFVYLFVSFIYDLSDKLGVFLFLSPSPARGVYRLLENPVLNKFKLPTRKWLYFLSYRLSVFLEFFRQWNFPKVRILRYTKNKPGKIEEHWKKFNVKENKSKQEINQPFNQPIKGGPPCLPTLNTYYPTQKGKMILAPTMEGNSSIFESGKLNGHSMTVICLLLPLLSLS